MNRKLTLSMNEDLIKEIKKTAETHNSSVSRFLSDLYIQYQKEPSKKKRSPQVEALSGLIDTEDDRLKYDDYAQHILRKNKK